MIDPQAKEIIKKIRYITIASVTHEGFPWNSPVFAAHDYEYNFYFGTHRESQKAKNIFHNPNVFLAIYDSSVPAGEGGCVYIRANAHEITDEDEIAFAHNQLWGGDAEPFWKLEEFAPGTPLVLFRVVPEMAWMNAEGEADGHYIDVRREISLT
jgi:general stress protein 26